MRGAGGGGRSRRPGGGGPSDEEVLIALMKLVREGHPLAARVRERYQQDGDQQAFLEAARALLADPNDAMAGAGGIMSSLSPATAILNGQGQAPAGGEGSGNPALLPTAALAGLSLGGGAGDDGEGSARLSRVLGGGFGGLTVDASKAGSHLSSPGMQLGQGQGAPLPPGLAPIGSPRQQQQYAAASEQQSQAQQQQQQGQGQVQQQQGPPQGQFPPGMMGPPGHPPFGLPGGGFGGPFQQLMGGPPGPGPQQSPQGPGPMQHHGMPPLPNIPLHVLHSLHPSQIPPHLLGPGGLLPPGAFPPMMPPQQQQGQQQGDGGRAASPLAGPPGSPTPNQEQQQPPPGQQQGSPGQDAGKAPGEGQQGQQQAPRHEILFPGGLGGLGGPMHAPPGGMPPHGFPPLFPGGPFPPSGAFPGWMGPPPGQGVPMQLQQQQPPPPQGSPKAEEQKEGGGVPSPQQQQEEQQRQRLLMMVQQQMRQQQQQQQQQQHAGHQFMLHQMIHQQQLGYQLMMQQQQQRPPQPPPQQQPQQQSSPLLAALAGPGPQPQQGNGDAASSVPGVSPLQQLQEMLNLSKEAALQDKDKGAEAEAGGDGANGGAEGAAKTKQPPKRTARNQVGRLWVLDGFSRQPLSLCRPKGDLVVQWEAPLALVQAMAKPEVALFRLGVASNQNAVIAKAMNPPRAPPVGPGEDGTLAKGTITFYAPRSAGTFVFRMFDAADPTATHATSARFHVEVQGVRDIEGNLRLILGQLRERKSLVAGLSQLHLLLRDIRPFQYRRNTFPTLLWDALSEAVTQLGGEQSVADKDERGRSKYPVQSAVALILQAAINNRFIQTCLDGRQRAAVRAAESLWCPLAEEFFESEQAKRAHHEEHFGFAPNAAPLGAIPQTVGIALSRATEALLPSLLPSDNFLPHREEVRARVEAMLASLPAFPAGTRLRVFGSSANNFGSDSADLDMCVTFPPDAPTPEATPAEMIEALAAHLEANGMEEVDARSTARIPIVLFVDPATGLDCDVSVENPLALRNTQLLHAYSLADPRVRALAYAVKHWARRRKINNASEGTLSSYGYVLLVLHFLQTRRPFPILPSLQRLPPDWTGGDDGGGLALNADGLPAFQPPPGARPLPQQMVRHSIEKDLEVDTYFYSPPATPEGLAPLRRYGARNPYGLGSLLIEFFRYYAWEFDYREHVVSVRTGGLLRKEDKAEDECWPFNARLAIEDPFEVFYNVAHFIREGRHRHIRVEFARAYTLCCEEAARVAAGGGEVPDGAALLERLTEEADDPPARTRQNTMVGDELLGGDGQGGGAGAGAGGEGEEGMPAGPEEVVEAMA